MKTLLSLAIATLFLPIISCHRKADFRDPAVPLDERVENLLSTLTVPEKIDLLCAASPGIKRLGIPAYDWWSEGLHGVGRNGKATVFPKPIGLGSTWDTSLVRRIADAISDEARAKYHSTLRRQGFSKRYEGLTYFSPTINIARDPRWGRTSECFSEDPLLTGAMGSSFIQGMQGNDPRYLKILATPKHFVANNEENRRNDGSAEVDEQSLREYYFPAFRRSVTQARAGSVMAAYNALNGVPCCANPFLLTNVLRKEWGFDGVVMSDGSAIEKIYSHHHFAASFEEGAAMALKAGCDMSLRDEYRPGLAKALQRKLISEQDIDRAVKRVLRTRFRLGMFDPPQMVPYASIPEGVIESEEHRKLSLEAAQKSIVLLKNENNILPIQNNVKKIALIGSDFQRTYYGDYSGQPDHNLSLFKALKNQYGASYSLTWVPENPKSELIPSQNFLWAAADEYDGKLGLKGEYYSNTSLQGQPVLVRRDQQVRLIPSRDQDPLIKQATSLSAKWSGLLQAPITGTYRLLLEGSHQDQVWINNRPCTLKTTDGARFTDVQLESGKNYPIQVVSKQIDPQAGVSLKWLLPVSGTHQRPEDLAKASDIAIIFLRDDAANEGRDRTSLQVQKQQADLIARVSAANPNTILLLGSSTTLILGQISAQVKAIMSSWIAGQSEAQAIVDLLFGKVSPSGKTPLTYFADERELPPMDHYDMTEGRSYQYFKGHVLYPFGFGLSYTRFSYSKPVVVHQSADEIQIAVQITNTGGYDGDEVVQCYASNPQWKAEKLEKKLLAFSRLSIPKGTTKQGILHIHTADMQRWDAHKHQWVSPKGTYSLHIADQIMQIEL